MMTDSRLFCTFLTSTLRDAMIGSASVPYSLNMADEFDMPAPRRVASSTTLYEQMSARRGDIEEENLLQVTRARRHHHVGAILCRALHATF